LGVGNKAPVIVEDGLESDCESRFLQILRSLSRRFEDNLNGTRFGSGRGAEETFEALT